MPSSLAAEVYTKTDIFEDELWKIFHCGRFINISKTSLSSQSIFPGSFFVTIPAVLTTTPVLSNMCCFTHWVDLQCPTRYQMCGSWARKNNHRHGAVIFVKSKSQFDSRLEMLSSQKDNMHQCWPGVLKRNRVWHRNTSENFTAWVQVYSSLQDMARNQSGQGSRQFVSF